MKPVNNHTPTAYNETNKIKKSLETSTKDIINTENHIRNIKNSEQMESFEKTDSSIKELWGIVDGLADNGSPWFIVS